MTDSKHTPGPVKRPVIINQGTVVVEQAVDGEMLVMLPDGTVHVATTRSRVERLARAYFKRKPLPGIGVGSIEWRHGLGDVFGIRDEIAKAKGGK